MFEVKCLMMTKHVSGLSVKALATHFLDILFIYFFNGDPVSWNHNPAFPNPGPQVPLSGMFQMFPCSNSRD